MYETTPTPAAVDAIRAHRACAQPPRASIRIATSPSSATPRGRACGRPARVGILKERGSSAQTPRAPGGSLLPVRPPPGTPSQTPGSCSLTPSVPPRSLTGSATRQRGRCFIEDRDRGHVGQREIAAAHRRRAQATRRAGRPGVDARRRRCQRFLVAQVRAGARVDQAICALDGLRNTGPSAYTGLMCALDRCQPETLRVYWSAIPIEVRNAARREGARGAALVRVGQRGHTVPDAWPRVRRAGDREGA